MMTLLLILTVAGVAVPTLLGLAAKPSHRDPRLMPRR